MVLVVHPLLVKNYIITSLLLCSVIYFIHVHKTHTVVGENKLYNTIYRYIFIYPNSSSIQE